MRKSGARYIQNKPLDKLVFGLTFSVWSMEYECEERPRRFRDRHIISAQYIQQIQ